MIDTNDNFTDEEFDDTPLIALDKDLRDAAALLPQQQAQFLVDTYYKFQHDRIQQGNQIASSYEEPNLVLQYLFGEMKRLESFAKSALDRYTDKRPVSQRLKRIHGIGPVLSAGFLAHLDINQAASAGAFVDFAGYNTGAVWLGSDAAKTIVLAVLDTALGGEGVNRAVTHEEMIEMAKRMGACPKWLARRVYRIFYQGDGYKEADAAFNIAMKTARAAEKESLDNPLASRAERKQAKIDFMAAKRAAMRDRAETKKSAKVFLPQFGFDAQVSDEVYVGAVLKGIKPKVKTIIDAVSVRPWNPSLKTILWKMTDVMRRQSNNPKCFYGQLYRKFKLEQVAKNEAGLLASEAERRLKKGRIKSAEQKTVYQGGKLPDSHVDARAMHEMGAIFLSHLWEIMYEQEYGKKPPAPYAIAILGHKDYIPPPV